MKIFLSSTFNDLARERTAVRNALAKKHQSVLAMEYFLASPSTPIETALKHLRESDVVLLVIGFRAGSLVPGSPDVTYTSAEYDEAVRLGKHVLAFLKKGKKWLWSSRREWFNKERGAKARVLESFRANVGSKCTWVTFETPDQLALGVIQSLEEWESRGRPGARRTFAEAAEFFASKMPQSRTPLLDFSTSLLGREEQLQDLNSFACNVAQCACIVIGRGGIGKSKLLHDWCNQASDSRIVFLKDEPIWHEDSEKEIPTGPVIIVVDDAQRSQSLERVIQLFKDFRARHRHLKLVLSTRPGGSTRIAQLLYKDLDTSEVVTLPELRELSKKEAVALANEVLGNHFSMNAEVLAEVAGNTPLVIVAGGRFITSSRIHPAELSNFEDFRNTVFTRFLDELHLNDPRFVINPPSPLLELVAAIGPVQVNREDFLQMAEVFFGRRRDEILATFDELASIGILTGRAQPMRIVPDVVSDFILERRCVGTGHQSTGYADLVYNAFGPGFFRNLMRNLSELDWRLERAGYGFGLLSGIWHQIGKELLAADEYGRHRMLSELIVAAMYQPVEILRLVDLTMENPIATEIDSPLQEYRAGQSYVLEVVPTLLEATANTWTYLSESVDRLWKLAKFENKSVSDHGSAVAVLKRLAAYDRRGWLTFNFGMLLQAIRLSRGSDAYERAFTPIDLVDVLLEREGDFNEYSGNTITFGGFGLNIEAVGPLRTNALDFLETLLSSNEDVAAVRAAQSLGWLLPAYLNRVGRQSSDAEVLWQNDERLRSLGTLSRAYGPTRSLPVRRSIYHWIRSGTGINCPELVRNEAREQLRAIRKDAELVIFDALCTGITDLPLTSRDINPDSWQTQSRSLMSEAHELLNLRGAAKERAKLLVGFLELALAAKIEKRGFDSLIATFDNDPEFLCALADELVAHGAIEQMLPQMSVVLSVLHGCEPAEFDARAKNILRANSLPTVRAAAAALRVVSERVTLQDAAQIKAFLSHPDEWVRRLALGAIAYMGKNNGVQSDLLSAALSVDISASPTVASALCEVFGPYGLPISLMDSDQVTSLLNQLVPIPDLDVDQGSISRFLSQLVAVRPDHVVDFLLTRVATEIDKRKNNVWWYFALNRFHENVSFAELRSVDRSRLCQKCLEDFSGAIDDRDNYRRLFWMVAGLADEPLDIIETATNNQSEQAVKDIAELISDSGRTLAFTRPEFAKRLLSRVSGPKRQEIIRALVHDAHGTSRGVFVGEPADYAAQSRERFTSQVNSLSTDEELGELVSGLRESLTSYGP